MVAVDVRRLNSPVSKFRRILTSHSIDNLFDACARKFEFLNIYDRRPPRESSYAADVGTALHEGLQSYLIARAEGRTQADAESAGYLAMMIAFPWKDEPNQHTRVRSFQNTSLALNHLMRANFWNDWELVRVDGRGWAVEIPFLLDHVSLGTFVLQNTGETCILSSQGKIDFILRHKATGRIRCWDLKTTITSEDLMRSEYTFSGQQVGYDQILKAILGEEVTQYDMWYVVCRFSASDVPEIQTYDLHKSQDDIDDYWLAKLDRFKRIIGYAERGWFPRRNGGCNAWQRECSCFDICHSRDYDIINEWFDSIEAVPQVGYDPWVHLEM